MSGIMDALLRMLSLLAALDFGSLTIAILLILLAFYETSYRVGLRATRRQPLSEGLKSSVGVVTSGLLTLFAFLLAISFSLASERYEQRRQSVMDEANALGTAWHRTEMIGGEAGATVQRLLHDYIQVRIGAVRNVNSDADERSANARTNALQQQIWTAAIRVSTNAPTPITSIFIASLNQVFDLATVNRRNLQRGQPEYGVRLLVTVAILAVASMGYQFGVNQKRQFAITFLFMVAGTLAIVLILDIDRARNGTVRVNPEPLIWTMQSWEGGAS